MPWRNVRSLLSLTANVRVPVCVWGGAVLLDIESCGSKGLALGTNKELPRYSGHDREPGGSLGPCLKITLSSGPLLRGGTQGPWRVGLGGGLSCSKLCRRCEHQARAAPSAGGCMGFPVAFRGVDVMCAAGEPGLWGSQRGCGLCASVPAPRRMLGFWTTGLAYDVRKKFWKMKHYDS